MDRLMIYKQKQNISHSKNQMIRKCSPSVFLIENYCHLAIFNTLIGTNKCTATSGVHCFTIKDNNPTINGSQEGRGNWTVNYICTHVLYQSYLIFMTTLGIFIGIKVVVSKLFIH